jgi:toxin-antitoxin system PIN domain toxin
MLLLDANILLYAANQAAPEHKPIIRWLDEALAGPEPVGFAWNVIAAFLRITTRSKLLDSPLTITESIQRIESWLDLPNVIVVRETESHWRIFSDLMVACNVAGNLVMDAHLAALAISHDAKLITCDADFARFPGLRWANPLEA